MPINYVLIGQVLRKAREERNLSQEQLGKKLGIRGASISLRELGKAKATFDELQAHARLLGCDIEAIFSAPGDRRAHLLVRMTAVLPLLDETTLETLEAMVATWERRYLVESRIA